MSRFTKPILFLLLTLFSLSADGQRFSMGFSSGIILSQLDGDGFTGYDKMGIRLGIRSQAYISRRLDIIFELNYEEKGSRYEAKDSENPGLKNQEVNLAYAEVPIVLRIYQRKRRAFFVEAGAAMSYLIKNNFKDGNTGGTIERYDKAALNFRRSELNAVLGAGFAFSPRFGMLFRTTIGVNKLYYNESVVNEVAKLPPNQRHDSHVPIVLLRNYLVSIGAYYLL